MTTNGDEYILPYLNKFEKATLSQGKLDRFKMISSFFDLIVSTSLNSTVNSQQLFSSIVTAIKDVSAEAKSSSS